MRGKILKILHGRFEPGPGIGPFLTHVVDGGVESRRHLIVRQPREMVQLDDPGRAWIVALELDEGLIQRQQTGVGIGGNHVGKRHALGRPTAFGAQLVAGMIDEDAAHGLTGGGKEMAAVLEALIPS
jgi:hypothetical protein